MFIYIFGKTIKLTSNYPPKLNTLNDIRWFNVPLGECLGCVCTLCLESALGSSLWWLHVATSQTQLFLFSLLFLGFSFLHISLTIPVKFKYKSFPCRRCVVLSQGFFYIRVLSPAQQRSRGPARGRRYPKWDALFIDFSPGPPKLWSAQVPGQTEVSSCQQVNRHNTPQLPRIPVDLSGSTHMKCRSVGSKMV